MKYYVAILITLISLGSFAGVEQKCFKSSTDSYEPGFAMNRGHYKGQCVDASSKRAVKILADTEKYIAFANFYHNHKFWIAYLPRKSAQETIFQIIRFKTPIPGMVAAHTQLRFKLNPADPMILYPQDSVDQKTVHPEKMTDITYSVEAARPAGVSYNVFLGQFNFYGIGGRLLSTESRGDESFGPAQVEKDIVYQVATTISPENSDRILSGAIHRSHQLQLNYMYNTLLENCTTELFDLFDFILEYPVKIKKFHTKIWNLMDPIDGPSRMALKSRQLIDQKRTLPTLNDEFSLRTQK